MNYFFSKIFRKHYNFKNMDGVRLKKAFTIGTFDYYEAEDLMNLPYQRGLACIDAFNQLRLGVFPEDIEYVCKQVNEMYAKQRFSVNDLIRIKYYLDALNTRQQSQFRHPDLMYKLASICFIDETENVAIYDAVYAQKKIEYWKQHKKVSDFFLQMPIQRLIPFLVASEENSQFFSTLTEQLKKEEGILGKVSTDFLAKQKEASRNGQSKPSAKQTGRNSPR